jgi:hypothetical protein
LKKYILQYIFKVLEVPRNFFQEVSWKGAGATPLHARASINPNLKTCFPTLDKQRKPWYNTV